MESLEKNLLALFCKKKSLSHLTGKTVLKKSFRLQTAYLFISVQRRRTNYVRKLSVSLLAKLSSGITNASKILVWTFVLFFVEKAAWGVHVCVCVLTTCWMTGQPSDRSSDRVTARWQPPRASSGKPFETGSHLSADTKTPAGTAVDGASSKSSGWKLNQCLEIANCLSKYLAKINDLRSALTLTQSVLK